MELAIRCYANPRLQVFPSPPAPNRRERNLRKHSTTSITSHTSTSTDDGYGHPSPAPPSAAGHLQFEGLPLEPNFTEKEQLEEQFRMQAEIRSSRSRTSSISSGRGINRARSLSPEARSAMMLPAREDRAWFEYKLKKAIGIMVQVAAVL